MAWMPDVTRIVQIALAEDIGTGDITTVLTVPEDLPGKAVMIAKSAGTVAGLPLVQEVYRQLDPAVQVRLVAAEGSVCSPGQALCEIWGPARSILTGERVALNFLQRLSGIATKTARFVEGVAGTRARIVDTRKTTPGLRDVEKYAVRVGGGFNHRYGLYDAILIKDNHIQAAGSITAAVEGAFAGASHVMTVTVECETLAQVEEAIQAGADIVLLDNMSPEQLRDAVDAVGGQAAIEASGGITEETVEAIAATGVDLLSVGALTHSAVALDISLDLTLA